MPCPTGHLDQGLQHSRTCSGIKRNLTGVRMQQLANRVGGSKFRIPLRLLELSQALIIETPNILFEPMSDLDLVKSPFTRNASPGDHASIHELFDQTSISSELLNQFIQIVEIARHGFSSFE
jgi:hypothetical protein